VRNDGHTQYTLDISVEMTVKDSDGTTVDTQDVTITDDLDVNEWVWVYFNFSDVSEKGLEIYDITVSIDMSTDQDSYDDSKMVQVYRYWVKWYEDLETAGLNTDPQYAYPMGSQDPYEGTYCMIERISRYENPPCYDVSAYIAFNMSGWDNVGIGFFYDVYLTTSTAYRPYYHAEVYASDDGGSSWVLLGELEKDMTINNWQSITYDVSGNPNIDMTDNVTFRFRWRTTNLYAYASYYFKWDAITLTGDPLDYDVAIRELGIPADTVRLGEEFDLYAKIKNVGLESVSPSVNILVTDQWGNEVLNDTKSAGTLQSGWSKEVTWANFNPSKVTRYYVNATAVLAAD